MIRKVTIPKKEAEQHRPFSLIAWLLYAGFLACIISCSPNGSLAGEPPAERLTLHPGISYAAVPGNKASVFAAGDLKLGIKAGPHLRFGPSAVVALTDRNDESRELSAGAGLFLRVGENRTFAETACSFLGSLEGKNVQRFLARCSFGTTRRLTPQVLLEPQVFVQFESASGTAGDLQIVRPGIQISFRKGIIKPRP